MHQNAKLLHEFYEAFAERDGEAMGAAYRDDAFFSDPVFPDLDADGVRAMWAMLTTIGEDLKIEFSNVRADAHNGQARWEAWYTFGATGRKVHNIIDATFTFRDGRILRHTDDFDFWRWSRYALGPVGVVMGWNPLLQGRVRHMAGQQLASWRLKNT